MKTRCRIAAPSWPRSFDIFCRVIDNYGDIGVCWRLAQQLARHPDAFTVRLWVDDLQRCRWLIPEIDIGLQQQQANGVELMHWTPSFPDCIPHDVVIEAFACDPPTPFLRRLTPDHAWINLEYLSAEDWVEGCHGLMSPQTINAASLDDTPAGHRQGMTLQKHFFFPGFTDATGGLLREPELLARRQQWLSDRQLRWQLLRQLGLSSDDIAALQQGARQVLLFCYPHAPVSHLLHALAQSHDGNLVLIPENVCVALPETMPPGVRVIRIPFVDQASFDLLLWCSDLNCVRGEDSLVRGLWAGRPLLWHIYPQAQDAHRKKLNAWLQRSPYPADVHARIRAWNFPEDNGAALETLPAGERWRAWEHAASQWMSTLSAKSDLVTSLLEFLRQKRFVPK